jgi:hypothetical protein
MAHLDGKTRVEPIPFDAHERLVRKLHSEVSEYPKAVAHDEYGEPILVNSAEEEQAYADAHKEEIADNDGSADPDAAV